MFLPNWVFTQSFSADMGTDHRRSVKNHSEHWLTAMVVVPNSSEQQSQSFIKRKQHFPPPKVVVFQRWKKPHSINNFFFLFVKLACLVSFSMHFYRNTFVIHYCLLFVHMQMEFVSELVLFALAMLPWHSLVLNRNKKKIYFDGCKPTICSKLMIPEVEDEQQYVQPMQAHYLNMLWDVWQLKTHGRT